LTLVHSSPGVSKTQKRIRSGNKIHQPAPSETPEEGSVRGLEIIARKQNESEHGREGLPSAPSATCPQQPPAQELAKWSETKGKAEEVANVCSAPTSSMKSIGKADAGANRRRK
jgi:hypothetical protein